MEPVIYEIDRHNRLRVLSGAWALTAAANGAPHLSNAVIGRPIWDFITGDTTRQFYEGLIQRARTGRRLSFHYRCDSPEERRYMRMRMGAASSRGVRFETDLLLTRAWPATARPFHMEGDEMLRVCSWCLRVLLSEHWVEPETAVERIGMFLGTSEPTITHGICTQCAARLEAVLREP